MTEGLEEGMRHCTLSRLPIGNLPVKASAEEEGRNENGGKATASRGLSVPVPQDRSITSPSAAKALHHRQTADRYANLSENGKLKARLL